MSNWRSNNNNGRGERWNRSSGNNNHNYHHGGDYNNSPTVSNGTTNSGGNAAPPKEQDRIVVEREIDWPSAMAKLKLRMGNTMCLGFDCEWVGMNNWLRYEGERQGRQHYANNDPLEEIRQTNGRHERVSLMQIATYDGLIVLVRLVFFKAIPKSMKEFFADGNVLKVGVNIFEDSARLYKDWGLLVNGWLDLRNVCMEIPNLNSDDVLKFGLKTLGAKFCEDTTQYEQRMRFSNWCSRRLTDDQLHYAAQDALMAVKVLAKLGRDYLNLPWSENHDAEFWSALNKYVRPYLNRQHDAERAQRKSALAAAGGEGSSSSKRKTKKEEIEDSSSDIDMDWSAMNETCSNRNAVLFFPQDETAARTPVAAISPLLLGLCDKNFGTLPTVTGKVDHGKKRYIVKMTLKKVQK